MSGGRLTVTEPMQRTQPKAGSTAQRGALEVSGLAGEADHGRAASRATDDHEALAVEGRDVVVHDRRLELELAAEALDSLRESKRQRRN